MLYNKASDVIGGKMDYNWMPLLGKFEEIDEKIIFKGTQKEYENKILGGDIGNLIFNKIFSSGTISAEIEFKSFSNDSSCEIILYYNQSQNIIEMLNAGIALKPSMFVIKSFTERKWNYLSLSGNGENLKSNLKYKIKASFKGSKLILNVNDIEVCSAIINFPIYQSQVGIWCQNTDDIIIHDFKVETEESTVFVVSEFSNPYDELYNEVIKKICNEYNLKAIRADEFTNTGLIISDIIKYIVESKIVIAEISPNNPNVYYEVGYAHALNKPTILLAEKTTKLPFDVSPFRVLFYENSIAGRSKIEEGLKKLIKDIIIK